MPKKACVGSLCRTGDRHGQCSQRSQSPPALACCASRPQRVQIRRCSQAHRSPIIARRESALTVHHLGEGCHHQAVKTFEELPTRNVGFKLGSLFGCKFRRCFRPEGGFRRRLSTVQRRIFGLYVSFNDS